MPPAALRAAPRDDVLQVRFGRIGDQVTICPFIIQDGRIMSEQASELTPAEGIVESLQVRTRRGTFRFEQALDAEEFAFLQECRRVDDRATSIRSQIRVLDQILERGEGKALSAGKNFDAMLAGIRLGEASEEIDEEKVNLVLLAIQAVHGYGFFQDGEVAAMHRTLETDLAMKRRFRKLANPKLLEGIRPIIDQARTADNLILTEIQLRLLELGAKQLHDQILQLASYSDLQSHSQKFLRDQERLLRRDNQRRILESHPELAKLPVYLWGAYDPAFAHVLAGVPTPSPRGN